IGESEIDHRIDELFRASENPKIAVLAHDARADVKIMAKAGSLGSAEAMIAPLQRDIEVRLDGFVYGADEETPESAIHAQLQARGWTAATAESCTGGRIAAALTRVPGSSQSFIGGIVAYDDAVKGSLLRVDAELLARNGAVSEPVALAMARGARAQLASHIAISTTGIAGPAGGSPDKPVGLVWFGLDDADGTSRAYRAQSRGGRDAIPARATIYALGILWRHLTRARVTSP
ncbi:MAG: nicotinamide-nucleotide amidohydrolase family protein, partial [Candidatus Eremiobacteraeota bacterium]|nr:nicotinamide-nucleotide amidohydrolase family protein [Candidatus Eremiobacteraeota bacterium]